MPFISPTWDSENGYTGDSPLAEGSGWSYDENRGWYKWVPDTSPTLDTQAIQNLTPYTINTDTAPGEARFQIDTSQPAITDPNAYYSQLASDLASKIWENNAANAGGRNTGYIDSLNSIKDINPAAYYSAQIQLLASEAGHAAAMGETSRQQTAQQQLQALLPQALQAGVSSTQANSVVNSSFAEGAGLGSRIKSQAQAGSGFWKDNLIGTAKIAALAMGAYGLDTALAAGAAGAEAGAAGSGGAFTPTAGSSFAIDPSATYTTSGLLGGNAAATTGTTAMGDIFTDYGAYPGYMEDIGLAGSSSGLTDLSGAQGSAMLESLGLNTSSGLEQVQALITKYGPTVAKALLSSAAKTGTGLLGTGNSALGNLLGGATGLYLTDQQRQALQNTYNTQSQAVSNAANTASSQAQFTPVGITTAFGQSNFQTDPVTGKLISAGYTPTAQVSGQIQNLMGLGAQALPTTTDTQQTQQNYIAQQQGLLAPSREQQLAGINNQQWQTGRTGLATGGTTAGYAPGQAGLMQTNPELAAYYNSIGQQNAQIASNAPTYAQNLLNSQIATGTGLFGSANTLQGYAQQPLTLSTDLAKAQAAAGASAGQLGLTGQTNAAQLAATGALQGQAAMQGTYNQLGQTATGIGNTIANWLS